MHPLTQKLFEAQIRLFTTCPILVSLIDLVASASPKATDRPERRRQQMRMLRQWERLEKAVAACAKAGVTDSDVTFQASVEPVQYFAEGALAEARWEIRADAEDQRGMVAAFLETLAELKQLTLPPRSYFKPPQPNAMMKAPLNLEEEFNTVVTSSEPSHTPLDKFLRGSLRSANALAELVQQVEDRSEDDRTPFNALSLEEAHAALLAQGFTR